MDNGIKAKLLALAALRTKAVSVDGLEVLVQEPNAIAFAEYGRDFRSDRAGATARLLAACVIDADGAPVLTGEEAVALARSARVSRLLMSAIMELAGFGGDDDEPGASDTGEA